MILIDEVDLHLHPRWQAEVVTRLTETFPNLQFILATHSPIVVASVSTECLRILDDFKLVAPPAPTQGRDVNSLLREVFDAPFRPQKVEDRLKQVGRLLDEEKYEDARTAIEELQGELGNQDPEITRLETLLGVLAS